MAEAQARQRWDRAAPADPHHPYLASKGIEAHNLRQEGQRLVVPIVDGAGKVVGIQCIDPKGDKRFPKGTRKLGRFSPIGAVFDPDATLLIGEGLATCATLNQATGHPVAVAFDCGNMGHVAKLFRDRDPDRRIILCSDDDRMTPGNPGLAKATAAAKAIRGGLAVPPRDLLGEAESDFNDVARGHGLEPVILAVEAAIAAQEGNADQEKACRRGFFLTPLDALIKEPTPTRWLVRGVLPADSFVMLVGDPAAGKSFMALHWAACLTTGHSTEDKPQTVVGPVVYIAGEGFNGIKRRLFAWFLFHGVRSDGVPLFVSSTGAALDEREGQEAVAKAIDEVAAKSGPPVAIIIDTLHRNMAGDENSAQDIGKMIQASDALRARYGATVILLHHSGHLDKTRGRGSSSLRAAVDVELLLFLKGGKRILGCSKMKDAEPPTPRAFRLEQVDLPWLDEDGAFETSAVIVPAEMPTGQEIPLTDAEKLGLETLKETMADADYDSATLEAWRESFYRLHHGDSVDSKKKAFQRVRSALLKREFIIVENDMYSLNERDIGTLAGQQRDMSRRPPHKNGTGRDNPFRGCPAVPVTVHDSGPSQGEIFPNQEKSLPPGWEEVTL